MEHGLGAYLAVAAIFRLLLKSVYKANKGSLVLNVPSPSSSVKPPRLYLDQSLIDTLGTEEVEEVKTEPWRFGL